MCGICGIYSNQPIDESILKRMNDSIAHRGPDDAGFYLNPQSPFVALANRRLSIIDLSPAGHQPMANEDQSIWIAYNGEIYNYIELRSELQNLGHRFRSDTDTEVIIHSYEQWGADCLKRFNGMWAFAIWDARKQQLFCARDYFGIKPFYYFWDGQTFVFASEIKALLQHPAVPKKPNETIIYDYLTTGWLDHTDETFFSRINQLRPAHYLTINPEKGLKVNNWWNIVVNRRLNDNSLNGKNIIDRFNHLFEDSIKLRLRSDVPVGTCLSGGLDSSSIVCCLNNLMRDTKVIKPELIGQHQKTFSACYDDQRIDERRFIQEVLAKTGAESHLIFPDAKGLWEDLSKLIWHQDEPFGSTSIYAQWSVMRLTAQNNVKVLLDGQGADELLAGYVSYQGTLISQLISRLRIIRAYREFKNSNFNKSRILLHAFYLLSPAFIKSIGRSLLNFLSPLNRSLGIVQPDWAGKFSGRRNLFRRRFSETSDLASALYEDVFEFSLPALLRYEDRNSMAFSIEARMPFLDHRLVEFIFALPAEYKIRNGWTKWLLREAMQGRIPEPVRTRRDKIGFGTPETFWLRQNRQSIVDLFSAPGPLSREFINPKAVLNSMDNILSDDTPRITNLWKWINLELWLKTFWKDKQ